MGKRTLTFLIPLLLIAARPTAAAQQHSIAGVVRDDSGVIPGATVILASAGREVATTTTNGAGQYRFEGVSAGRFELTASLRGFEPAVRNVTVAADDVSADFVLGPGRVSTTLTVTATAGRATASRLAVPDDDLPAQVSSIPQELLRQQAVNSVMDALRNASGVEAFRWYGAYEQYTIRGFNDPDRDAYNAVLVDGMRFGGNRYSGQTNNIESVEVLKGPSSVLYGRGAVGGSINLVRKKPQAVRAFDFGYRGGSFNTHQLSSGATGAIAGSSRWLYRVDGSFEHSDGWRDAGADRLNVSPSLTALLGQAAQLSVFQTFNRNRYDGDGGVPLNIVADPRFDRESRFSLPQDNVLVEDSQTQFMLTVPLGSVSVRNAFQFQRTSDRYFVTEGVYGDPPSTLVSREPLDFHHIRRPMQNQAELVAHVDRFGQHNILVSYEYLRDKYRTEVTAGDDPDCLCGYWWLTIAPMDFTTMAEPQSPLDLDTVERTTYVNDRMHSLLAQDQIDITAKVKVNLAGRVDFYDRSVDRVGGLAFTPQRVDQTAGTYRVGAVYAPRNDQQLYVGFATSFTPVTTVPANGAQLDPSTARSIEVGHRWQGWSGRFDTSAAFYHVVRNNVTVQQTPSTVLQVNEQRATGFDMDVNADLGWRTSLIFNYGYSAPVFRGTPSVDGRTPRFVPGHLVNAWLRKDWRSGVNASFGARHVGEQYVNDSNTRQLDAYTTFTGAVGFGTARWDWSLNVDNLFDHDDYFLPGHFSNLAFPGPPVSLLTTLRLKL